VITISRVDSAIAELASTQHGLVTHPQLVELGLAIRAIGYRIQTGRLIRLYRGVYAVGHRPVSSHSGALAAVLACGPGAVLSHGSAGTLWGVHSHWRTPLEVTAPSLHRQAGLLVHRSKTITPRDVTVHFGVPVTTPARTLLDLAARLDDAALTRAFNDLRHARYLWPADLGELLDRTRSSRAVSRLRYHVGTAQAAPTRSRPEDDFRAFAARYGLPPYETNAPVAGHEVDVWFAEHRLAVEVDGWDFHNGRAEFERDRDRDADLLAVGIPTLRVTTERLRDRPDREAARLLATLTVRTSSR
jgi:hypothetical protein